MSYFHPKLKFGEGFGVDRTRELYSNETANNKVEISLKMENPKFSLKRSQINGFENPNRFLRSPA